MQTIPFTNLFISLLPLIILWYFYKKWTGNKTEIIYSTLRMLIQLLTIGYLLIYLFEEKSSILGIGLISFMIIVSSFISLRNSSTKSLKEYSFILFSVALSGLFHLFITIEFVLDLDKFYEPRFVIPIAGMIFINCMHALSLVIERFQKELLQTKSFMQARKNSFKLAMIPQINAFFAVGLVALPGMMTGQILSGVDPLVAVRYQIMIMSLALSSAGISLIIYFILKEKYD